MTNITFLTGAGISQESGIETFRGCGGLWGKHNVGEVASIEGWYNNPELCLEFYDERRNCIKKCKPNVAHLDIANFQKEYPQHNINIITQNVDDLHERAGSENVLHLHGRIDEVLVEDEFGVYVTDYSEETKLCKPNVVMFGEDVPNMIPAIDIMEQTDYLIIVGTSLVVYPANTLVDYVNEDCYIMNVNPEPEEVISGVVYINKPASIGVGEVINLFKKGVS